MGRGRGAVAWHPIVVQLDSEGKSVLQMMESLSTMDNPPTKAAVRKFLERAHKDPNFALMKLSSAPAVVPGLTIEKDRAQELADAMTAVEMKKASLSMVILNHMEKVLTARVEPNEWELKKFELAVEAMKSIKGNVFNVTATQNNQTNNTINVNSEEQRRIVIERLTKLA